MCEPVASELLAGPTQDNLVTQLERLVNGLPSLAVDPLVDFRSAATLFRAARRSGRTVRSLQDCLIASVALRHGAKVVHQDADFELLASISDLDTRSLR